MRVPLKCEYSFHLAYHVRVPGMSLFRCFVGDAAHPRLLSDSLSCCSLLSMLTFVFWVLATMAAGSNRAEANCVATGSKRKFSSNTENAPTREVTYCQAHYVKQPDGYWKCRHCGSVLGTRRKESTLPKRLKAAITAARKGGNYSVFTSDKVTERPFHTLPYVFFMPLLKTFLESLSTKVDLYLGA